jgi:ankyrin repeat protein
MEYQRNISLCLAALKNDIPLCKTLLETGANTNEIHKGDGATPLICASQNGNLKIVQLLLKNGVDVNGKRNDGATALICASQKGHSKIVELLLKNDADDTLKRNDGATALICAERNNYSKIVQLLWDHDADVGANGDDTCELSAYFDGLACLENIEHHHIAQVTTESYDFSHSFDSMLE